MRLEALTAAAGLVAAVRTAVASGIVDVVADGIRTPAAIADRCKLPADVVEILLRQLQLGGVCERDDDGGLRLTAPIEGIQWTVERWDQLGAVVTGGPPTPTGHLYPAISPVLATRLQPAARAAAAVLATPGMHLLDLGGGASPVGQALVAADPSARVTVVDDAAVLDAVRPLLVPRSTDQASTAFTLLAADITADPLPEDADVVLLSGVLHLFDEATIVSLLRRAERCAVAGGRVAIMEPLLADSHELDPGITSYELDLFLRQPHGGIWPYSRLAGFCVRAGLRRLRRDPLPGMMSLVTGLAGAP